MFTQGMCLILYKYPIQNDGMTDEEDMQNKVNKKMKEGWIKSSMMVEVMAINPEKTKEVIENHIEMMSKEDNIIVSKKEFKEVLEAKSPYPNIPKAYSCVAEIEVLTQSFDELAYIVMNYGPSSIEILKPDKISMNAGEAQAILSSISAMLHRFAASQMGGVMLKTKKEPQD